MRASQGDYATALKGGFGNKKYNYTPDEIAQIRLKLKMSLAGFAKLFFVDKSTATKWESGDRIPSGSSMRLLQFVEVMANKKHSDINSRIRNAYKSKYGVAVVV